MSNISTAKTLTIIGVILTLILAFIEIGLAALWIIVDLMYFPPVIDPWNFVPIGGAIVAIVIGLLIYIRFLPMIETDPRNAGIYLLVFGIIGAITAYWIGGIIVLIAGVLLLVESEGGA